jgi:hypothetical protein
MGFDTQPNPWQCGPYALKHALLTLGVNAPIPRLSKLAGTHWRSGTDEHGLARAARAFKCRFPTIRRHDPDKARQELVRYLRKGIPVLLCVHEWAHWVTVVKQEQGKYIVFDSQEPPVMDVRTWSQLKKSWVYHEEDEVDEDVLHTYYDFHPVIPQFRVRSRARFSLATVRYIRRKQNQVLARLWDEFVDDLLQLCKLRTPLSERVMSMGEFLRRHEAMILEQVSYWHGDMEKPKARRLLDYFHIVADTLDLVIHDQQQNRAIAGITSILSLGSAGDSGVVPVYRLPKRSKKNTRE